MCTLRSAVLRAGLFPNGRAHVVGLVFVVFLSSGLRTRVLLESPSREVLLVRREGRSLRHIAAGAHCARSRNQVLKALGTAAIAKSVLGCVSELGLAGHHVLGAGVRVVMSGVKARLRADLWRTDSRSTVVVGLDGVIQEKGVLVEIIFGLFNGHPVGSTEGEFLGLKERYKRLVTYVSVLNLVIILVDWTWRSLGHVFLHSQLTEEDLVCFLSLGLAEGVVGGGLLIGEWQLAKRCASLLTVELDGELVKSYTSKQRAKDCVQENEQGAHSRRQPEVARPNEDVCLLAKVMGFSFFLFSSSPIAAAAMN